MTKQNNRQIVIHMLPATSIGDCIIVKFNSKTLLIDTNSAYDRETTLASVQALAPKIDYMMISHYHEDHVELLNDIAQVCDIKNATIFLPEDIDSAYMASNDGLSQMFHLVQNVISDHHLNVVHPNVYTKVTIDGVEITFYNTDHSDYYIHGDATELDYNNTSLCALFKLGHTSMLFTGDLGPYAQDKIYRDLPPVTILKTPHHAGDPISYSSLPFYQRLRPKLMVGCSPCGEGWDVLRRRSFVYKYAQANNIDNYATGNTGKKMVLYIDDYGYHLEGGETFTLDLTLDELHYCKGIKTES